MCRKRHGLETILVSWCLIHGALSVLTKTPLNVIIDKGDDVYMECSTDLYANINTITWNQDGGRVTALGCSPVDSTRFNTAAPTANDCFITGLANAVRGNQGPYSCSDGSALDAEAVAVLIDPTPTCGAATPPIRGQDVTLSCIMSYERLGDERRQNPGAVMTTSISWETSAGTFLSDSSTTSSDGSGGTLHVDVVNSFSGSEIPSYTCTATFQFANRSSLDFTYALNSLSRTCKSPATLTWYCPSSVTVTPSSGPFETGDVLTCQSDGYPEPSYTWTDAKGVVVSTSSTLTLMKSGAFNMTCTASGNFSTSCNASDSVSGTATGEDLTTVPTMDPLSGVSDLTTALGGGNGNGTAGETDGGLSEGAIIGIAVGAALAALLLLGLILAIVIWRRRQKRRRPYKSLAFYQAVWATPPTHLAVNGNNKRSRMMNAYQPGSIDNHVYCSYCSSARYVSPHYTQHSVPFSSTYF